MVTSRNMANNDKQVPDEVNNHQEDPTAMMREMSREMETLKEKNVEKITTMEKEEHKR